jgi:hypothetical protein
MPIVLPPTPPEGASLREKADFYIQLHRAKNWPYLFRVKGSGENGFLEFQSGKYPHYNFKGNQNGMNFLSQTALGVLRQVKADADKYLVKNEVQHPRHPEHHTVIKSPASVWWCKKNITTHNPKGPITSTKVASCVEIDLNSAYAQTALNLGILSQPTFDRLAKAEKFARLIALGSLATKTTTERYFLERTQYAVTAMGLATRAEFERYQAQKQAERRAKVKPRQAPKKIEAGDNLFTANLWESPPTPQRSHRARPLPYHWRKWVVRKMTNPAKLQAYQTVEWAKAEKIEKEDMQIEAHATRPDTANLFFTCADIVGNLLHDILEAVPEAYFFWVDAMFVPDEPETIAKVVELCEAAGYKAKIIGHKGISLEKGAPKVHLAKPDGRTGLNYKLYPISSRYTNEGHAAYNSLCGKVRAKLQDLSLDEIEAMAEGQAVTISEYGRMMKRLGFSTLNDYYDIIETVNLSAWYGEEIRQQRISGTAFETWLKTNGQRLYSRVFVEVAEFKKDDIVGESIHTYTHFVSSHQDEQPELMAEALTIRPWERPQEEGEVPF